MKKLSRDSQINAQSHSAITSGLEGLTAKLSNTQVDCLGRKLTTGMVLNGLLLELLDLPPEEQIRIGTKAVRRLERWLLEGRGLSVSPGVSGDGAGGKFRKGTVDGLARSKRGADRDHKSAEPDGTPVIRS